MLLAPAAMRLGEAGDLDQVGLLLRASDTGRMERELVAPGGPSA